MDSAPYLLVVEDDTLTRQAMKWLLERAGHQVVCVGDGQEALDYLAGHAVPSLILLDLNLPVVSGWEFRERQRRDPCLASIPVIAVSAENDLSEEADHMGLDGFLQKPVKFDLLLHTVRLCGA